MWASPGTTSLDLVLRGAAGAVTRYLAARDRVGLVIFAGRPELDRSRPGPAALPALARPDDGHARRLGPGGRPDPAAASRAAAGRADHRVQPAAGPAPRSRRCATCASEASACSSSTCSTPSPAHDGEQAVQPDQPAVAARAGGHQVLAHPDWRARRALGRRQQPGRAACPLHQARPGGAPMTRDRDCRGAARPAGQRPAGSRGLAALPRPPRWQPR